MQIIRKNNNAVMWQGNLVLEGTTPLGCTTADQCPPFATACEVPPIGLDPAAGDIIGECGCFNIVEPNEARPLCVERVTV